MCSLRKKVHLCVNIDFIQNVNLDWMTERKWSVFTTYTTHTLSKFMVALRTVKVLGLQKTKSSGFHNYENMMKIPFSLFLGITNHFGIMLLVGVRMKPKPKSQLNILHSLKRKTTVIRMTTTATLNMWSYLCHKSITWLGRSKSIYIHIVSTHWLTLETLSVQFIFN